MTNFQIYRKILSFSLLDFVVSLFALAVLFGSAVAGFFIANTSTDKALIGLVVGFVIGIILAVLISYLVNNRIKAAQISIMVKGITEGQLPEHPFSEGFKEIKGRFGKITVFFFIINMIKGMFNQLGRTFNRIGTAIGGSTGSTITSVIDSAVQTLVAYLADCCLGWILYRKDENSFKAGCEGAVIFFKHGKTLIRNVGRIFGMGLLSFVVVGGAIFGLSYVIFMQFPQAFNGLINEIVEAATRSGEEVPEFVKNPTLFMIVVSAFLAIVLWSILHSVLGRPFILVGVMRNFMEAGIADMPTEADFAELDQKSPRFRRLHDKMNA